MNDVVYALSTHNNDLVAGGYFTTAGGETCDHIARWARPAGACCLANGDCALTGAADCTGTWLGADTSCAACPPPVCRGDCDCNGSVGFSDIDFFVAAIPNNEAAWQAMFPGGVPPAGCTFANCDANGNGSVGFDDIDPFVARIPSGCP